MWRLVYRLWSSLITLILRAGTALSRSWQRLLSLPAIIKQSLTLVEAAGPLVKGLAVDLIHNKQELLLENVLLRQQLSVLQRQVKRPSLNNADRAILVLLAQQLRTWKTALLIVKPETLLRWHCAGFHLFWKLKSRTKSGERKPPIAAETIEVIKQMALANSLWGAERIN